MNTGNYYSRKKCRICEGLELDLVLPFPDMPFGDEYVSSEQRSQKQNNYPLNLVSCRECGLLQILEVVNPGNLYLDYLYESKTSIELNNHFNQYADYLCEKWDIKPGDLVLEIGCNDGMLLLALAKKGIKVIGVDPARRFAKYYEESDVIFVNDFFSFELAKELYQQYGAVKAIIANNVFANIDDLSEFNKGINCLLADKGYFIMESGWSLPLLKDFVVDNVHHEHYSYFGVVSFRALCDRNNMKLIDVERIDTKGGSLRYIAVHNKNNIEERDSVDQTYRMELDAGLYDGKAAMIFRSHLETLKHSITGMLEGYKKQGMKIAGYGAAVGTTTLMYYFDVSHYIDVLYDDNQIKINSYSPGNHIPVKDSAEIYSDKPDLIFVFCWRYMNSVLKRHQDYVTQGGKFLLPLPECKIIDKSYIEAQKEEELTL
jgi:hypothetical protein